MKAVIPTGGRGTRMYPITYSANKHFIPIANKPLIYYPIETIAQLGITDVAITYNPGWLPLVKSYLGDGSKWGLKFSYILQEKPAGLADIVRVCEEYMAGEPFVFHLGDNIFAGGIKKAYEHFMSSKPNGCIYKLHHPENRRLGVPYFDEKGVLVKYVEKPDNPPHDFAIPGVYFLDSNVFKCFKGKDQIKPSLRGELEIPTAIQWMVDHGYQIDVVEYDDKWLDPGKFDDWIEANKYLLDNKLTPYVESIIDETVKMSGNVKIGKNCNIKRSEIKGPAAIGDGVTLLDSFVGPYSSISNLCEIKNSHLSNSVLMDSVKITNIVHTIDDSLIGTGAEITGDTKVSDKMNFFIGEKCKIKL